MVKYIAVPDRQRRPHADYYPDVHWAEYSHLPRLVVTEDNDPQNTGLLDSRGNPFYRVKERGKLGF